ncbi:hypothetical protein JYG33_03380 [Alcaligenes sp. SORT26]|uniref:hypothetical protein n=1 Tax=Alcaligenes sp. SORT26 TaxID=2813780 RepID=UPI001A9F0E5A|nr:hypothetical protein [Alcaligenes sp. SORT26]QTC00523.1 hypothetical protein JYG33_03380 [Alcaligenes sp. SORT26]
MNFESLLSILLTSTAVSGSVAFLLKKWLEHSLNAKLAELELKNRMRTHEHQIRFTRFDQNVTSAIEGAYELVCEYTDAISAVINAAYMSPAEVQKEYAATDEIAQRFLEYMRRKSIYLPKDIADQLVLTRLSLRDEYMTVLERSRRNLSETDSEVPKIPALIWMFEKSGWQRKSNTLMHELQELVREHLSQFVLKKN